MMGCVSTQSFICSHGIPVATVSPRCHSTKEFLDYLILFCHFSEEVCVLVVC